jgi:hypothetical protein
VEGERNKPRKANESRFRKWWGKNKDRAECSGSCLQYSYLGGRVRPAQAKSSRDPMSTNKTNKNQVHACHSNYVGSINRRMAVQANPDIIKRPY